MGQRYQTIDAQRQSLVSQLTEISEALSVAARATDAAYSAHRSLEKAESWATWDMWSKGGILTHAAKYSHVDEAERTFSHLTYLLRELRSELADVRGIAVPSLIQIDSGERALEFWFDNIFFDHAVRKKIIQNIERVGQLIRQLDQVTHSLQEKRQELEYALQRSHQEEEDLLVSIP